MKFSQFLLSSLCLAVSGLTLPVRAQAPYSSLTYVVWDKPTITVDDCKSQGGTALSRAGMGNISFTKSAVFSTKTSYEAYVYCVFEGAARIGVIGVSGPDDKVSAQIRQDIYNAMVK